MATQPAARAVQVAAVEEIDLVLEVRELRVEARQLLAGTIRRDPSRQDAHPDALEHEGLHELEVSALEVLRAHHPHPLELLDQGAALGHAPRVDERPLAHPLIGGGDGPRPVKMGVPCG